MIYYYPSCNYTRSSKENSEKIKNYLSQKGIHIARCCRVDNILPTKEDTVLTVCQSCTIFLTESSLGNVESLFVYLDQLDDFVWPDYHAERMTIQDCFKAKDHPEVHQAVRSIMKKMNIEIVETDQNKEDCEYCGNLFDKAVNSMQEKFAPHFFGEVVKELAHPLSPEQQKEKMIENAKRYTTEKVVGYCNSCVNGINAGGKTGIHLMDLILRDL